jgi:hypothetical protein
MTTDEMKAQLAAARSILNDLQDWVRSKRTIGPHQAELAKELLTGLRQVMAEVEEQNAKNRAE